MKDVKNILDIPNIEKYLDKMMYLKLYDVGDNTLYYSCDLGNNIKLDINFITKDEKHSLIEGQQKLSNIICSSDYEIVFFEMSVGIVKEEWNEEDGYMAVIDFDYFQMNWFRPLVDEKDKNY